jgi:hypothetical protein
VAVGRDRLHVFDDLFLVPDVVAGGQDVSPEIEEFIGYRGCYAKSAGCILGIDDDEVDLTVFEHMGKVLADDAASGTSEYISYKKNVQGRFRSMLENSKHSMLARPGVTIR